MSSTLNRVTTSGAILIGTAFSGTMMFVPNVVAVRPAQVDRAHINLPAQTRPAAVSDPTEFTAQVKSGGAESMSLERYLAHHEKPSVEAILRGEVKTAEARELDWEL